MAAAGLLSVSDLCERFDRNAATIRTWVKRGYLPAPTAVINRQHFWDAKAIDALKADPRELASPPWIRERDAK